MTTRQLRVSRQSIVIAAALTGVLSLAIGAHAALKPRGPWMPARQSQLGTTAMLLKKTSRIALVIGNGHYPDADAPLTQSINDARDLAASLRGNGFNVDILEDASKDGMRRAIDRPKSKTGPDSVVMLFSEATAFRPAARAT